MSFRSRPLFVSNTEAVIVILVVFTVGWMVGYFLGHSAGTRLCP